MTPIIEVENLSKRYLVGRQADTSSHYIALRDVIARGFREFVRKTADMVHGRQIIQGDEIEEFWALKDVSFEVKQGEVLGIIGRNGAGKSTLLKILSRITDPTEGRVVLRGRGASLLQVGTGFHPELTGRENVHLNGAVLGMSLREIKRKFDEIVAFAEVEQFLDTPVKRYSSGMYVRLAFAVAAHLEPEIMFVDEVLAVGDYNFQRKCLGKMQEMTGIDGRTVLFVSHNMNAVTSLCARCILLVDGKIKTAGRPDEVVEAYLDTGAANEEIRLQWARSIPSGKRAFIEHIALNANGNKSGYFDFKEPLSLTIQYRLVTDLYGARCAIEVCNSVAVIFKSFDTDKNSSLLGQRKSGLYAATVNLPKELLKPGRYFINVDLAIPQGASIDRIDQAIRFEIVLKDVYAATVSFAPHRRGIVAFNSDWTTELVGS
jgi:lipopolysaccharide transport system ATP-binding protein